MNAKMKEIVIQEKADEEKNKEIIPYPGKAVSSIQRRNG
jgi:hypothetical protein